MTNEDRPYNHCFILGAGFSCAYSAAAPTMANFLKQALDERTYQPDGLHKDLATLATRYFGSNTTPDLEMLASFLVQKSYLPMKEPRPAAYEQLLQVIKSTLSDVYQKPRNSEVVNLFKRFATVISDSAISVITLNYDLLLDQLLMDTGNWSPVTGGYGFSPPILGVSRATGSYLRDQGMPPRKQSVFLKLHGSLNWGKRNVRFEDGSHPIEVPTPSLSILPIEGAAGGEGPATYFWTPYIIPPLMTKSLTEQIEPEMENIWYQARWVLTGADVIHVLGYSMRQSDLEMEILMREGLYQFQVKSRKKIVIVDRCDAVRTRIADKFRRSDIEVDVSKSDISAYLRELIALLAGAETTL